MPRRDQRSGDAGSAEKRVRDQVSGNTGVQQSAGESPRGHAGQLDKELWEPTLSVQEEPVLGTEAQNTPGWSEGR